MLGHKVYQVLSEQFDTYATVRAPEQRYAALELFARERLIGGVDAAEFATVRQTLAEIQPDVVINCIGIVKQVREAQDPVASIAINALFPHQLQRECAMRNARLIHVSTDCVFSGRRGAYREDDSPDPVDLYGQSKQLGEPSGAHCLTMRTSIIGREIADAHGLVEWFLSQRGRHVKGYANAIFSGLTTLALSRVVAQLLRDNAEVTGLYHVSADHISKHDLLVLLRDAYGLDTEIEVDEAVRIDRSLDSSRFRQETGIVPPAWPAMIAELVADETPYETWRRLHV
jgi:dTDP-4-dehydrorhamnose reductase